MKPLYLKQSSFRQSGMHVFLMLLFSLCAQSSVHAQFVMMPDSTNNRLVLFDPFDGSLVNGNLFSLQSGTPFHAMHVGNEIWVSEQVGDRISRWDFDGTLLGNIGGQFAGGGLDNIRGMEVINNTVYVTNAGTNNNAPGAGIVRFDMAGNNLGFFGTTATAPSPFGILAYQGGMLVSSSSQNDDIHRFDLAGNSLGVFHNSTGLNFAQQMALRNNGNIVVGGFSVPAGIYELDGNTGSILNSYALTNALRGVYQLQNGNILWSSAAGAFVLDPSTNISSQVYAGGGRYFDYVSVPEPSSFITLFMLLTVALGRPVRQVLV